MTSIDHQSTSSAERPHTRIDASAGLADLLRHLGISFAFTSYQSGQLFMVGVNPDGRIAIDQQRFERAMGVHWAAGRLHLATATQIIRFENMLGRGEIADGRHDAVFVPRISWTTNDVDAHELAVDGEGRPIFVATRFNCIATVDPKYSFAPVWMPNFIPGSDRGDRCHLNGMATENGALSYASVIATTSEVEGWRLERENGGAIIDCRTNNQVISGLAMPHSPRVRGDDLWFLESGAGLLARYRIPTRTRRDIAFLPGFARGLAFTARHALVTVSKPRDARFDGLKLGEELRTRGEAAWCGVLIIDVTSGSIAGWIRLDGLIEELFDVTALPSIVCPRSLGPQSKDLWDNVWPRPPVPTI